MSGRRAFTLIELLIIVAILSVLVAVAMPNYIELTYRSKRSELMLNASAIKHQELATEAAYDSFIEVPEYWPDDTPGRMQRPWTAGSNFDALGWTPDGAVRGSYRVLTTTSDFTVEGISDVDGDGVVAQVNASKSTEVELATDMYVY